MLNQIIMVGRVEAVSEDFVVIAVTRNYKDKNSGEYLTDLFKVYLQDYVLEDATNNVADGDTIAIKGRLEQDGIDFTARIIVERISFISKENE